MEIEAIELDQPNDGAEVGGVYPIGVVQVQAAPGVEQVKGTCQVAVVQC